MFDLPTLLTVGTLALVAVTWLTDYFQWRSIRAVQNKLDAEAKTFEERGSVGDQIGDWLLEKEAEDKPNNLQVLSNMVGQSIASSFKFTTAGMASGDMRRMRAIEKGVMEAAEAELPVDQQVMNKLLQKVAGYVGLEDLAPSEVLFAAKKLGLSPQELLRNNGEGNKGSW